MFNNKKLMRLSRETIPFEISNLRRVSVEGDEVLVFLQREPQLFTERLNVIREKGGVVFSPTGRLVDEIPQLEDGDIVRLLDAGRSAKAYLVILAEGGGSVTCVVDADTNAANLCFAAEAFMFTPREMGDPRDPKTAGAVLLRRFLQLFKPSGGNPGCIEWRRYRLTAEGAVGELLETSSDVDDEPLTSIAAAEENAARRFCEGWNLDGLRTFRELKSLRKTHAARAAQGRARSPKGPRVYRLFTLPT